MLAEAKGDPRTINRTLNHYNGSLLVFYVPEMQKVKTVVHYNFVLFHGAPTIFI